MNLFKKLIDLMGRIWSRLVLRFGYYPVTGSETAKLNELQRIVDAEGLEPNGDRKQLIQAVVRLYRGYKKAYERAAEQSNERLERIELLSKSYLDLRSARSAVSGMSNDEFPETDADTSNFNRLGKRLGRLFSKGVKRIEIAKLNDMKKIVEFEKLTASGEGMQMVEVVKQLFSGYKKAYEEAETQSVERLERIRLISSAYQNLRNNQSVDLSVPNRKVAVIHVPKTGGTSLRHELISAFPDATLLDAGNWPLERAEAGELDVFDMIFGHMYLHNLDKHEKDRYKIIFVRDPITQAASVYAFLRSFANDPAQNKRPDIIAALRYDFDAYVKTSDPQAFNAKRNRLARSILGEHFKDRELDSTVAKMIKEKLQEIEFVGIYESFAEDCQELLKLLGAKSEIHPVWLNKTTGRVSEDAIPQETKNLIFEKSSLDVEIYKLALSKRQEHLDAKMEFSGMSERES